MSTTDTMYPELQANALDPDDPFDHILCCDVNEAVCGRNVKDVPFCVHQCSDHETCPDCEAILSDDTWICPDCRRRWS
jgi:hypothetical protein